MRLWHNSKLIEDKFLLDADDRAGRNPAYLNQVPLVKRLLELRPMLKQQSVGAALGETMIIELDFFNEIKKLGQTAENVSWSEYHHSGWICI